MIPEKNGTPVAAYTIAILGSKSPAVLTLPGRLPGLNEYTAACRTNAYRGHQMKREAQETAEWQIMAQLRGLHFTKPVFLLFTFYEPDKRRDKDNVSAFAHKVIQDALVQRGVLLGDGWGHVTGYLDQFRVDKGNPRIVVEFIEQEVATCKERRAKSSKK